MVTNFLFSMLFIVLSCIIFILYNMDDDND